MTTQHPAGDGDPRPADREQDETARELRRLAEALRRMDWMNHESAAALLEAAADDRPRLAARAPAPPDAAQALTADRLADALGAMSEAYNVTDYTDEQTTWITAPVETIADRLAAEPDVATLDRVTVERDEYLARLTNREREHAERLAKDANHGDTGICRTCAQPITFTTVTEPGYLDRTGWSDGARRDALVCFKAVHYRHAPLVGRERGIWDAATRAAADPGTRGEGDDR